MNQEQNNLNNGYSENLLNNSTQNNSQFIQGTNSANIDLMRPSSSFEENKPIKNNNKRKIIPFLIIVIVLTVGILMFVLLNKNDESDDNNDSKPNQITKITEMTVNDNQVIALTANGDLYAIGETSAVEEEDYNKVTKISTNVGKYVYINTYNVISAIYLIDNNNDLYYVGASYNAGSSSELTKDAENVIDIKAYGNFCGAIINENNEFYLKNSSFTKTYCGIKDTYEDFTKMADNVREVLVNYDYNGYITNDGELFISTSGKNYTKRFDNVKDVYDFNMLNQLLILTNDNKLYNYEFNINDDDNNSKTTLLASNVEELGQTYFKTTNGEYNIIFSSSQMFLLKNKNEILNAKGKSVYYYSTLDVNDIKKPLYYKSQKIEYGDKRGTINNKFIYISTDNQIVLMDENGSKKLSSDINNLEEIYQFVIS